MGCVSTTLVCLGRGGEGASSTLHLTTNFGLIQFNQYRTDFPLKKNPIQLWPLGSGRYPAIVTNLSPEKQQRSGIAIPKVPKRLIFSKKKRGGENKRRKEKQLNQPGDPGETVLKEHMQYFLFFYF